MTSPTWRCNASDSSEPPANSLRLHSQAMTDVGRATHDNDSKHHTNLMRRPLAENKPQQHQSQQLPTSSSNIICNSNSSMCNPKDIEMGSSHCTTSSSSVEEFQTLPLLKPDLSTTTPSKPSMPIINDASLKSHTDSGLGSAFLDTLPPTHQMTFVSLLMFLFFGMHNVLQEAIVGLLTKAAAGAPENKVDGTIMLGYAEVIGVLVFSYLERIHIAREPGFHRVAPLRAYPLLTGCLFASSSLCNMSLSYINFPTKVVFRSCKLVPTMIIATIVNKKVFASYEYVCALAICAGLVLFALADYTLDPLKFDVMGLALVSGSVVADAILPNAQESLFRGGASRLEVTVYSNLFSFLGMTVVTLASGTLVQFVKWLYADSTLALYFGVYTLLSYASISCYMTLVKRFGGVHAVLLTTARKAMTLVLSFLLFPKGFSWLYFHGSFLVLGAVMVASIFKKLGRDKAAKRNQDDGKYNLSYRRDGASNIGEPSTNGGSR
jgi:adenosine 3'-phospho 5'-phosphosulfate transporter B3